MGIQEEISRYPNIAHSRKESREVPSGYSAILSKLIHKHRIVRNEKTHSRIFDSEGCAIMNGGGFF